MIDDECRNNNKIADDSNDNFTNASDSYVYDLVADDNADIFFAVNERKYAHPVT